MPVRWRRWGNGRGVGKKRRMKMGVYRETCRVRKEKGVTDAEKLVTV